MAAAGSQLNITLHSFGDVTANKPAVQYLIDVRTLRDPVGQKKFVDADLDGTNKEVKNFVMEDERVVAITEECRNLVYSLVNSANVPYVSVGFLDYHGRWIAPAVCELVADALDEAGFPCSVSHHELEG